MGVQPFLSAGELAATGLLLLRMVVVGFLQPPGRPLSWPMFTRGCYIDFSFEVAGHRIDALSLVPAYAAALTPTDLQLMADHLTEMYGEAPRGTGRMWHVGGAVDIHVEDGHVVV